MDNLCHSLIGMAASRAGLNQRTAMATSTLVIANNLPDIDVAVFATDTLAMSFRRGWTHGVLAQATLPIALTAGIVLYDRYLRRRPGAAPVKPGQVLLLSYTGVLLHVFMDLMNSYGVRLLMPFSERWFYGDALYIVDPWLYLALGLGWWLASRNPRPARIGLTVAAVYVLVMLASNVVARREVADGLLRAGRPADTKFMVTPVFAVPFRREVIVDVGDRYEKGNLWFDPLPHFRPAGFGIEKGLSQPGAEQALRLPRARAFLRWSRFPFLQADAMGSVWINDYRYANAGPYGWSAVKLQ
ncbi:MAG TPA: metal-dependent hydrolase [Vicinamibacterales bacterium]|nr:metal-dependent hydrolase [Vicinamibacterales bacterium]